MDMIRRKLMLVTIGTYGVNCNTLGNSNPCTCSYGECMEERGTCAVQMKNAIIDHFAVVD